MVVVTGGSLGFGSYVNVIFALFLMTPPWDTVYDTLKRNCNTLTRLTVPIGMPISGFSPS